MDNVLSKVRGIVNYFNLKAEELGLKHFQIAQRKADEDEHQRTLIEVKAKQYSGVSKSQNSFGFFVTQENGEPENTILLQNKLENFLQGAAFILKLYGFDQDIDRFKWLAEKLNFIQTQFIIDDPETIKNYLWDNVDKLNLIANVKYQAYQSIGENCPIGLSLVPVYERPDEKYLTFDFNQLVAIHGFQPVDTFYREWVEKQAIPADFLFSITEPKTNSAP